MSIILDPQSLILYETPPEWPTVPRELIEKLIPVETYKTVDQWNRVHTFRTPPMHTPEQKAMLERIALSRHFLVKLHETARCGRCGGKHGYVTSGCIELPFNGLTDITRAIVGKPWQDFGLSKVERREIDPGTSVKVPWHTVTIGDIVPITEIKARALKQQIRMKGIPIP